MSTTEMDINGLILESRCSETLMLLKGPLQQVWRDGFPVQEQKILRLQFDRYLCEVDQQGREQEWTEEERLYVARGINAQLSDPGRRDEVWVHVVAKPPLPWPTYDETHPKQIHTIAKATGVVREALAYEQRRDGGPRPDVVRLLEASLEELPPGETEPEPEPEPEPEGDEMYAM
jgi:hypothetical protein